MALLVYALKKKKKRFGTVCFLELAFNGENEVCLAKK